jgi:predicted acyltransferase
VPPPYFIYHAIFHIEGKYQMFFFKMQIFYFLSYRKFSIVSNSLPPIADNKPRLQRLLSLDFLRGLIMVLLALEAAGFYKRLKSVSDNAFYQGILEQFNHHPWHGLRMWDLVQPAFMFMAGTAMAFSLARQNSQGVPWSQQARKALTRSCWLFFWGVLDYAVKSDHLSFELWDVLTQLSFTTLVAFLIFRWNFSSQVIFSLGLLLLTECLYRFTNIPGFDQPFTNQHNFGNYMDQVLMNKINKGGWVAINCLPTAAHTIWGVLAGKLLLEDRPAKQKLQYLFLGGVACFILGYGLDWLNITPIIKRIATTSFTLASGAWVIWALLAAYAWVDVLKHPRYLTFFTIVGMNSIFLYLFFEIVGHRWFNEYVDVIVNGVLSPLAISEVWVKVWAALTIFALEWGMCYFLFKKKIFFRA